MSGWREIKGMFDAEIERLQRLARYDGIKLRARRVFGQDYEPEALAAAEAAIAKRHEGDLERARTDPSFVMPIGKPASPGHRPWLDNVPIRHGVEEWADLPTQIILMLTTDDWASGEFEFIDPADYRRRWFMEQIEVLEATVPAISVPPVVAAQASDAPPERLRRPRRAKYDSEAFITQAVEVLKDEGGFGPAFSQAQLHDAMERWCNGRWPETPSRAWMYQRFDEAEQRYQRYRSSLA